MKHLFRVNLSFQAAGQTDVTIDEIVSEKIHLAVLETAVLIYQFGILGLALIVIGLTDKLPLIRVPGADKLHDHYLTPGMEKNYKLNQYDIGAMG
jgi:hypothetical protein